MRKTKKEKRREEAIWCYENPGKAAVKYFLQGFVTTAVVMGLLLWFFIALGVK